MDIFVRSIPPSSQDEELKRFLGPLLQQRNITDWSCVKMRGKGCGLLRIEVLSQAHSFIQLFDGKVYWRGQRYPVRFEKSKHQDDGKRLRNTQSENRLQEEIWYDVAKVTAESQYSLNLNAGKSHNNQPELDPNVQKSAFEFNFIQCGHYEYNDSQLEFRPIAPLGSGRIVFGNSSSAILIDYPGQKQVWEYRINIHHWTVNTIVVSDARMPGDTQAPIYQPSLVISLQNAPKIFKRNHIAIKPELRVLLNAREIREQEILQRKLTRVSHIGNRHKDISGLCFVYRLVLSDRESLHRIHKHILKSPDMPASIKFALPISISGLNIVEEMAELDKAVRFLLPTGIDFKTAFQIMKVAFNGKLLPSIVRSLLPCIQHGFKTYGSEKTVVGIRDWYRKLPDIGPDNAELKQHQLGQMLSHSIKSATILGSMFDNVRRNTHLMLVHRFRITPSGVYLEGPEPEPSNRVLRRYAPHIDSFARVTFSDEDGERLEFGLNTDLKNTYHEFLLRLMRGIEIFGRKYSFLGFSSSSLRSQTCWFMSLFIPYPDTIIKAYDVIEDIGDFSNFQVPAKCAARIGQAFTETNSSVKIEAACHAKISDIERNNRCFSDGCGTISSALLREVCAKYPRLQMRDKPVLLQIRFMGIKGMVSLDSSLPDTMICTRPSMMKFTAFGTMEVEVCGIADRKIPLYLNRPLIKVLEDLGVESHVFIKLQNDMMSELELMLNHPINASTLLAREKLADVCGIPDLISLLYDIGLDAQDDEFIRSVVEFAALCQLREVKYRGRIRVPHGVKLYGVMDETGFLGEGQIYCSWLQDGKPSILHQEKVLVTRSPTTHPGDVQLVDAVMPPQKSPLRQLYNCVVFSQFGSRDLASQLGGGDLDGDQFDVIWDRNLIPDQHKIHNPADYPKLQPRNIGRRVVVSDIMEFFIAFMENDRVGQISSLHLQLADRLQGGTTSEQCIKLAEMASIAVDYGKSGIAVDMDKRPKFDTSWKPDFMAPGPKVEITKAHNVSELLDLEYRQKVEPLDAFQALDQTDRPKKYYQSEKVLGKLYRLIDERKFYQNIQKVWQERPHVDTCILQNALNYVLYKTKTIHYQIHKAVALEIRDIYETHINNTRYEFSFRQSHPLHELEVIATHILGSNTRANRETSRAMRESVEGNLAYVKELIIKGPAYSHGVDEDVEDDGENLSRSIACFKFAMDEESELQRKENIHSWKYFAAAVCLRQLASANAYGGYIPILDHFF